LAGVLLHRRRSWPDRALDSPPASPYLCSTPCILDFGIGPCEGDDTREPVPATT